MKLLITVLSMLAFVAPTFADHHEEAATTEKTTEKKVTETKTTAKADKKAKKAVKKEEHHEEHHEGEAPAAPTAH